MPEKHFDIIVIGAGHAGVEAGLASARMGLETLILTINLDNIALMPCNPSIGGSAKGHLVREIDALGGQMGKTIDRTYLQVRTLNKKKGPAIQAYRAQADKILYQAFMKKTLEEQENLHLLQGIVTEILEKNQQTCGVRTITGQNYFAKAVIITTGTFLNGRCHIGKTQIEAGRIGEPPSKQLSKSIQRFGIQCGRLKTGTPPRLLDSSIDFQGLALEVGETPTPRFSFLSEQKDLEQIPCHISSTTAKTKQLMEQSFDQSPLFSGQIEGIGPRYCPSIEDKYKKFPDKESHLVYLEPESRYNHEIYLQGFSTSLPHALQIELVRTIPGLGKAHMLRPGYAVEYDFFNPIQLYPSLESKLVEGLFFAGQINGTSGYEEAGAQGIVAGINAALKVQGRRSIEINRENSYTGVLIHDLVTKGTKEPYRMFSSLVEFRTYIRHDNADHRLTKISHEAGLADSKRLNVLRKKREDIENLHKILESIKIETSQIKTLETNPFDQRRSLKELLRRPELDLTKLSSCVIELKKQIRPYSKEVLKEVEIETKYEGYIQKQKEKIASRSALHELRIPINFNYNLIKALSNEGRERLREVKPEDVAQAALISGVRQSDLALLISHIKRTQ